MDTQNTHATLPTFEGFKGGVFKYIKDKGKGGISFHELKKKFAHEVETAHALGVPPTNLHATLLVLVNGGHVKVRDGNHQPTYNDLDIFYVE